MDTVRVNNAPVQMTKNERSYSVIGFIGGFLVMVLGIMVGVPWLAAIGFVPMVVSFLFLNSMIWSKYLKNTSLSQMLRDRGIRPSSVIKPE